MYTKVSWLSRAWLHPLLRPAVKNRACYRVRCIYVTYVTNNSSLTTSLDNKPVLERFINEKSKNENSRGRRMIFCVLGDLLFVLRDVQGIALSCDGVTEKKKNI